MSQIVWFVYISADTMPEYMYIYHLAVDTNKV